MSLTRRGALASGAALSLSATLPAAPRSGPALRTGLDRLIADPARVQGKRLALLTHDAAVTGQGQRGVDAIAGLAGVTLSALFAPEHGLAGAAAAGEHVGDSRDGATGVPVFSLYGARKAPDPAQLAGLDLLVVDLQDVGLRCYTYAATALATMEVAAKSKVPVLLLDRPNPLGGTVFEGPGLDESYVGKSLVTAAPFLYRHGLTLAEMTRFLALGGFGSNIAALMLEGWDRSAGTRIYGPQGLPFVAPSPNLRSPQAILAYAATVLVEGTNLSEGRGSEAPFELVGAPWVDGVKLAKALNAERLPGVRFTPAQFTPATSKHAGKLCNGVRLTVTDERAYRGFMTGVALISAARRLHRQEFRFLPGQPPYFDYLAGRSTIREGIEQGSDTRAVTALCRDDEARFSRYRVSARIY